MLYITLFFTAFISATLLPSSSEVLMGGMIMQGNTNLWLIWFAATLGNVLGSCVNYAKARVDKPHALRFADSVSLTLDWHK